MSDGTYRDRWVNEVFRTPLITDAVRVALLALATDMDDAGMAVVRRGDLANRLSRSDRRIGDRLSAGIDAGFLRRVSRGQRNGDSRYQATVPDHMSSGHPGVPKKPDVFRTHGGPEDDSLQDGSQVQENPRLQDTRESPRGHFDPSVFRTPKGPEETPPPYKDRAGAHFNADRSDSTADVSGHGDVAVVISLFNEEITSSLRSQKQTPTRKRASEPAAEDRFFDEFWTAYPRRIAKAAARKAWVKAIKAKADPEEIIAAARLFATDPRRAEADIKYTPHPATWLNNERWADEAEPPATERAAANGYQPYRNPTDQSAYDEDL